MALERMPAEVWQTILRYSISVPVFFDPDPIESNGFEEYTKRYDDDGIYWRSERHRNVLRRVCSGWNAYLLQFSHRFVRLEDVWTGLIPVTSLTQAIRLYYDILARPLVVKALEVIENSLIEEERWALEILDGGLPQIDELIILSKKIPNLRCIAYAQNPRLTNIALQRPEIRFLDTTLEKRACYEPLQLSHLTSLSILFRSTGLIACDFPSLKHLSIYLAESAKLSPQELTTLLEVTGKNLITFLDNCGPSKLGLPSDIWDLCPNLKRFQTSLALAFDADIPDSLDTFQISTDLFLLGIPVDSSRLPIDSLLKAGITKVTFGGTWKIGLSQYPDKTMECALHIMNVGLSFYDIRGVKFQDMVITLLQSRKGMKRSPPPSWNQTIRWF